MQLASLAILNATFWTIFKHCVTFRTEHVCVMVICSLYFQYIEQQSEPGSSSEKSPFSFSAAPPLTNALIVSSQMTCSLLHLPATKSKNDDDVSANFPQQKKTKTPSIKQSSSLPSNHHQENLSQLTAEIQANNSHRI